MGNKACQGCKPALRPIYLWLTNERAVDHPARRRWEGHATLTAGPCGCTHAYSPLRTLKNPRIHQNARKIGTVPFQTLPLPANPKRRKALPPSAPFSSACRATIVCVSCRVAAAGHPAANTLTDSTRPPSRRRRRKFSAPPTGILDRPPTSERPPPRRTERPPYTDADAVAPGERKRAPRPLRARTTSGRNTPPS